jgi:hypothetical protein
MTIYLIERITKNIMDENTLELLKQYFNAQIEGLKIYIDERFKNMEKTNTDNNQRIESRLANHETRISNLENCEGNKAIGLLRSIKDGAIRYLVPSLIVVIVYLLSNGTLAKILGIATN